MREKTSGALITRANRGGLLEQLKWFITFTYFYLFSLVFALGGLETKENNAACWSLQYEKWMYE